MLRLLYTTEAYSTTGINRSTSGQARPRGIIKLNDAHSEVRFVYAAQLPPLPLSNARRSVLSVVALFTIPNIRPPPVTALSWTSLSVVPVHWTCANKANYYDTPPLHVPY